MRVSVPCAVCGAEATTRCSGCFSVAYCRTECQKADWAAHKPSCKKPYAVKENEKVGRWVTMNSIDNEQYLAVHDLYATLTLKFCCGVIIFH